MANFNVLPAGVRLDSWPAVTPPQSYQDSPEVAELRAELRKAVPEVVTVLALLEALRPMRELPGRLGTQRPAKVIIQRK
jgi:hypothetical protein